MNIFNFGKKYNTQITRAYSFENIKAEWAWEDAMDKEFPIDAFFKRLYKNVRRFIYNAPDLPRDAYRKIKRGVQRAYRGWADEDVWNMHHYQAKVVYEMLLKMKETRHGYPNAMLPDNFIGNITDEQDAEASAKWDVVLDKIIFAWKLNVDIGNGDREIYAPYMKEEHQKEFNCLTQQEECDRLHGMALYAQHFFSLWD